MVNICPPQVNICRLYSIEYNDYILYFGPLATNSLFFGLELALTGWHKTGLQSLASVLSASNRPYWAAISSYV